MLFSPEQREKMRFKVFKSLTNATQSCMSSNLRCHYYLSTDKKEKECYQLNYDVPSITRHFLSQRGCVEEDRTPDSACRSEWFESLLNCFLRTILKKAEIIISIFRWGNRFRVGKQLTQSHTAYNYNSGRTAPSYFSISFAISHSFHIPQEMPYQLIINGIFWTRVEDVQEKISYVYNPGHIILPTALVVSEMLPFIQFNSSNNYQAQAMCQWSLCQAGDWGCFRLQALLWKLSNIEKHWKNHTVNSHIPSIYVAQFLPFHHICSF